ncbi:unnamed protein product, partial [Prorocentrum cordatum]
SRPGSGRGRAAARRRGADGCPKAAPCAPGPLAAPDAGMPLSAQDSGRPQRERQPVLAARLLGCALVAGRDPGRLSGAGPLGGLRVRPGAPGAAKHEVWEDSARSWWLLAWAVTWSLQAPFWLRAVPASSPLLLLEELSLAVALHQAALRGLTRWAPACSGLPSLAALLASGVVQSRSAVTLLLRCAQMCVLPLLYVRQYGAPADWDRAAGCLALTLTVKIGPVVLERLLVDAGLLPAERLGAFPWATSYPLGHSTEAEEEDSGGEDDCPVCMCSLRCPGGPAAAAAVAAAVRRQVAPGLSAARGRGSSAGLSAARVPPAWGGGRIATTRCGHRYHLQCLSRAAQALARCPQCRAPFLELEAAQGADPSSEEAMSHMLRFFVNILFGLMVLLCLLAADGRQRQLAANALLAIQPPGLENSYPDDSAVKKVVEKKAAEGQDGKEGAAKAEGKKKGVKKGEKKVKDKTKSKGKKKELSPVRGPAGRGRPEPAWKNKEPEPDAGPHRQVVAAGRGRGLTLPSWMTAGVKDAPPPSIPEQKLDDPAEAGKPPEPAKNDLLDSLFEERDKDAAARRSRSPPGGRRKRGRKRGKGKGKGSDDEEDDADGRASGPDAGEDDEPFDLEEDATDEQIQKWVAKRETARRNKDFMTADKIRKDRRNQWVHIDGRTGTTSRNDMRLDVQSNIASLRTVYSYTVCGDFNTGLGVERDDDNVVATEQLGDFNLGRQAIDTAIATLEPITNAESFVELWECTGRSWRAVFEDVDVRDVFIPIDVAVVRQAFWVRDSPVAWQAYKSKMDLPEAGREMEGVVIDAFLGPVASDIFTAISAQMTAYAELVKKEGKGQQRGRAAAARGGRCAVAKPAHAGDLSY